MKRYSAQVALMFTLLGLLFPLTAVSADTGPKPSMRFFFRFQRSPIAIVDGYQLQCDDPNCADAKGLQDAGPQHFGCDSAGCSSMAYGYKSYSKIVIQFADRTRESNIFQSRTFDAEFTVTVTDSALEVLERPNGLEPLIGGPFQGLGFLFALLSTLVVETLVAAVIVFVTRIPRLVLMLVPLASLISLPAVWFVFPRLSLPVAPTIALAEGFAVVFEAAFLYFASRKALSFRRAFVLSFVMNAASFAAGYLILL